MRELIVRFTNAGSAPPRHAAAHVFVGKMHEMFIGCMLQGCSRELLVDDSAAPHPSLRDSTWMNFMIDFGLSDEELELAKHVYAYSQRTCAFCGSNSAPLLSALCVARFATASAPTVSSSLAQDPRG
jgi:hypothetical protein